VASFKIVQETTALTTVFVVPGPLSRPATSGASRGPEARLGESVTIDVKLVDVVPAEASGKFRYVISRVAA
jgi:phenylacetate-CoA ligase